MVMGTGTGEMAVLCLPTAEMWVITENSWDCTKGSGGGGGSKMSQR